MTSLPFPLTDPGASLRWHRTMKRVFPTKCTLLRGLHVSLSGRTFLCCGRFILLPGRIVVGILEFARVDLLFHFLDLLVHFARGSLRLVGLRLVIKKDLLDKPAE